MTGVNAPDTSGSEPSGPTDDDLAIARALRHDFERLRLEKQAAIEEVLTKISVLRQEFVLLERYNPIEHVSSRVKSPASLFRKAARHGIEPTPQSMREHIHDIAGVRITCSFIADTYRVLEALTTQDDVRVVTLKDYVTEPKPSGYRSLHAIVEIPVFLSTGPVPVTVEVQVRTIAMDFWASLEHKIFYKYDGDVPEHLTSGLTAAASTSAELDRQMEQLYAEIRGSRDADDHGDDDTDVDAELLHWVWSSSRRRGLGG